MEFIYGLVGFAVIVGIYLAISSVVESASDAAVDALSRPVEGAISRASLAKVSKDLAVPHEFRVRAPIAEVQHTLESLPGLSDEPLAECFAPFYLAKERGRIKFGIGSTHIFNHYDIELNYRPEPWGASGEIRFLRWPDDAHEDTAYHRDLVETVIGELRHLDPGMQVRRPEGAL